MVSITFTMDSFIFSDEFKTKHQDVYNRMYPNGILNKFAVIKEAKALKEENALDIQIATMKVVDMANLIQNILLGKESAPKVSATPEIDPYKIIPFNQSVVESTQLFQVYKHLLNFKNKIDNKNSRDANIYLDTMSIYILGDFENGVLTGVTDTLVQNYIGFKEMMKWRTILDKGINGQLTNNDFDSISNEIQFMLARISREFATTTEC